MLEQYPDHNALDLDDNSNPTFGLGNQTIGSVNYALGINPPADDEITLDSTLYPETLVAPLQGTQQGSNISMAVSALSMLSSNDLQQLLHLAQPMQNLAMDNSAGALAPVVEASRAAQGLWSIHCINQSCSLPM